MIICTTKITSVKCVWECMLLRNKLTFIIFFLNHYFKIDSHLLQCLQRKKKKKTISMQSHQKVQFPKYFKSFVFLYSFPFKARSCLHGWDLLSKYGRSMIFQYLPPTARHCSKTECSSGVKMTFAPAQISPGIHSVLTDSLLSAWRFGSLAIHKQNGEDWAEAQADPSLAGHTGHFVFVLHSLVFREVMADMTCLPFKYAIL